MARKIGSMFGVVATLSLATLFGCSGGNGESGISSTPLTDIAIKGTFAGF